MISSLQIVSTKSFPSFNSAPKILVNRKSDIPRILYAVFILLQKKMMRFLKKTKTTKKPPASSYFIDCVVVKKKN